MRMRSFDEDQVRRRVRDSGERTRRAVVVVVVRSRSRIRAPLKIEGVAGGYVPRVSRVAAGGARAVLAVA